MITAPVTAAIAAVLALFGIRPGPYLVVVALVVKVLVVLGGVLLASRLARRARRGKEAAAAGGKEAAIAEGKAAADLVDARSKDDL
jgi:hypothetical protein